MLLDTDNNTPGDEAAGLTIGGTLSVGEELTFQGSVYNDNTSFSKFTAQLWNLTDGILLAESGSALVDSKGTPVDFSVTYTATGTDSGDTLQLRFRENNNHTARDIYVDYFSLETSSTAPVTYEHPRHIFHHE